MYVRKVDKNRFRISTKPINDDDNFDSFEYHHDIQREQIFDALKRNGGKLTMAEIVMSTHIAYDDVFKYVKEFVSSGKCVMERNRFDIDYIVVVGLRHKLAMICRKISTFLTKKEK